MKRLIGPSILLLLLCPILFVFFLCVESCFSKDSPAATLFINLPLIVDEIDDANALPPMLWDETEKGFSYVEPITPIDDTFQILNNDTNIFTIGLNENSPFIYQVLDGEDTYFAGIDMEILRGVCETEFDGRCEFIFYQSVPDLIDGLGMGDIQLAVGGLSATASREDVVDLSFPYHTDGIGVAINTKSFKSEISILSKLKQIWPTVKEVLLILFVVLTIFAHMIWIVERFNNDNTNFHEEYLKGIGQAYWWALVTASTVGYGDITPKKGFGRFVAALVIIFGIMWFGYFIASTADVIAVLRQNSIENYSLVDVKQSKIGSKDGSTSSSLLTSKGYEHDEFSSVSEMMEALENRDVDAVVFDRPTLLYQCKSFDDLVVLDKVIQAESYVFMVQDGDDETLEIVDQHILRLKKFGELKNIFERWL